MNSARLFRNVVLPLDVPPQIRMFFSPDDKIFQLLSKLLSQYSPLDEVSHFEAVRIEFADG
jgi:hypothetical protein